MQAVNRNKQGACTGVAKMQHVTVHVSLRLQKPDPQL
jgi:hypothetical protein